MAKASIKTNASGKITSIVIESSGFPGPYNAPPGQCCGCVNDWYFLRLKNGRHVPKISIIPPGTAAQQAGFDPSFPCTNAAALLADELVEREAMMTAAQQEE